MIKAVQVLLFLISIAVVPPASGHSLKSLTRDLTKRENYFQAVNRPVPNFRLRSISGKIVSMNDLRGKVIILNFVFTRCTDICPLHTQRIAELQEMINGTPMKGMVRFVSITTDPKNDTPEILKKYVLARGLDLVNWLFLTTTPRQPEYATRRLAQAYGLKFTPAPNGQQMHGLVTHVIDQDGILRARFHGMKFQPVNLVLFVNALTNRNTGNHDH